MTTSRSRGVTVPGDKSLSHRALMFAALSRGESQVRHILDSADIRSTAIVLRALGVQLPEIAPEMRVVGMGRRGLRAPVIDLDCGNSGTTARLMAGIVAGHPVTARFTGDESLSKRPMRRVAEPLTQMGATFRAGHGDGLPMQITGGDLRSIDWQSNTASAQVKSAILLAGLVAGVPVSVTEPERSRDHTERMLAARGAGVSVEGLTIRLAATDSLEAIDMTVPGDPSSAAYFAALAALTPGLEVVLSSVGLNPTRTGFFRVLGRMGAAIRMENERDEGGEPVGDIVVRGGTTLHGIELAAQEVPSMIDEIPLLACIAARAHGETVVTGASELRVKESDRIAAVVSNLRSLGASVEEQPDGLTVTGTDVPLAGTVRTHLDHRIAMSFGVLSALPGSAIVIDNPGCVAISYPGFWNDLARVMT